MYERLYASCAIEEFATFGTIKIGDVSEPDISLMADFRRKLAGSRLGGSRPGFPAFITGGSADTVIPAGEHRSLYTTWCQFRDVDVTFSQTPGADHSSNVFLRQADETEWIAERLAGAPVQPGCREVAVWSTGPQ